MKRQKSARTRRKKHFTGSGAIASMGLRWHLMVIKSDLL